MGIILVWATLLAIPVVAVAVYFLQPKAERSVPSKTLQGASRGVLIVLAIIAVGALLAIGAKLVL